MELFHIHRHNSFDELYQEGKSFIVGKDYNAMGKNFMSVNPTEMCLPVGYDYQNVDYFYLLMPEMLQTMSSEDKKLLLCDLRRYLYNKKVDDRELILEQVRISLNKDLPSRYKCMWLADEKSLNKWLSILYKEQYDVFKVDVDGKLFKSSNSMLPDPTESHSVMYDQAYTYWNATEKELSKKDDVEYLFEGEVKLLKRVK